MQRFLYVFAVFIGLANVDELMAELLLPEDAENHTYSHLRTSVMETSKPTPLSGSFFTQTGPLMTSPAVIQRSGGTTTIAFSTSSQPMDHSQVKIKLIYVKLISKCL